MTTATQCTNCGRVSNEHLPKENCDICQTGTMQPLQVLDTSDCYNKKPILVDEGLIVVPKNDGYLITVTISKITPHDLDDTDMSYVFAEILAELMPEALAEVFKFEYAESTEPKDDNLTWHTHIQISS